MKLNTVTRAFGKRKGAQIKLEPREILANHQQLDIPTDEPVKMEGKGIFDDLKRKGKKMVKKSVREGEDTLKENAAEIAGTSYTRNCCRRCCDFCWVADTCSFSRCWWLT